MHLRARSGFPLCTLMLWCSAASGQSTQSLISGRVVDAQQGTPIAGAGISFHSLVTNTVGMVESGDAGYYVAPLLPPGEYRLRVTKDGYQAQELEELNLPVASSLEVDFQMRPLQDIWEEGIYRSVFLPGTRSVLTFYGPDVDSTHLALLDPSRGSLSPLETGISTVVDPVDISELPLAGRDVYATLVLQPGVTADTTTARGLGYSVNGQRPSSSNYLLDGVENDNYLVTGPLITVAPESVQEYRVSTNGFSAEYGGTSGFVANAVTKSGGSQWHGIGYFELENDVLDANTFENNFNGIPRTPLKEIEPGFQVGGPIVKDTLFESFSMDYLRSRSFGPILTIALPTTNFLSDPALQPNSLAATLLKTYAPPPIAGSSAYCDSYCAPVNLIPPVDVDRLLGLERLDYVRGAHRVMARLVISRLARPDFVWSPYQQFDSPLNDNTAGLALAWVTSLRPDLTNELRGSLISDGLYWNRAHAEIPFLAAGPPYTASGIPEGPPVILPGSPALYAYKNHSRNWEVLDNLLWSRGAHILKFGAGLLARRLDGYLTAGRDGEYIFGSIGAFAQGAPSELMVGLDRLALSANPAQNQIPNFNRQYSYNQYFLFAQDSFKVAPRLVLNYGLRYENFGAPQNTGPVKDAVVQLGPGNDFTQRLATATLQPGGNSLYAADNLDFSARLGFGYSLRNDSRTVLRGGYGIFYDRPFDNLWQNLAGNNVVLSYAQLPGKSTNYLAPVASVLPGLSFTPEGLPNLTLYQGNIRNGYAQDYFLGIQHQVTDSFTLEINGAGSLGRRLITTDVVNREDTVPGNAQHPDGYPNPQLGSISYRGSQGSSDYNALSIVGRYRTRRAQFQIAYTWSHSIDNQSDPLLGDFLSLDFTAPTGGTAGNSHASFSRQYDSSGDRGDSDFDQRHNLVFYSIWEPPPAFSGSKFAPLFRNWRFSQVGAIRSGFPFSVYANGEAPTSGGVFMPYYADLINPNNATANIPARGGRQLLNPNAFGIPADNSPGNTGRNEFRGPGLYSIDVSLSRSFPISLLGETGRLIVRADAYNPLNHANLDNPQNTFFNGPSTPGFGTALYGRSDLTSGFPAVTPFNETARQIQLMLRVEF